MVILCGNIGCVFRAAVQVLQAPENRIRNPGIVTQGPRLYPQRTFFEGVQQQIQQTGQVKLVLNAGRIDPLHQVFVRRIHKQQRIGPEPLFHGNGDGSQAEPGAGDIQQDFSACFQCSAGSQHIVNQ